MNPIEEFSDTELIEELSKRFDDFILSGRKVGYGGESKAQSRRFWNGDMDACVGLIQGVSFDILSKKWGIANSDIVY